MPTVVDPSAAFREALVLHREGRDADARAVLDRALEAHSNDPRLAFGYALLERDAGRIDRTVAWLERASAAAPGDASLLNNLGLALLDAGRGPEAIQRFRQSLAIRPGDAETHGNLIFALDADPRADLLVQQRERRRWYEAHAATLPTFATKSRRPLDPARPLRVGYVSADFCRHSAAAIFGPVVMGHDPAAFEVVCFSSTRAVDETTTAFKSRAAIWRDIADLSDEMVAALIVDDGIDILVDLSGHSAGGRLLIFARQPAPIQISAWGHATGTGLPMIDALFADDVVVPPAEARFFAEKVEVLPCLLTFEPLKEAPCIDFVASRRSGRKTFGSFCRIAKLSDEALGLWSRIVLAEPGSRLMLKDAGFDDPDVRTRTLARLEKFGLPGERIELRGRTDRLAHLAAYAEIDVALDPFPMNGGLGTLEALWMGVPVVALCGKSISARGAASILTTLGREEWIAGTETEYRDLALALGRDIALREGFRKTSRDDMTATPLADPTRYVRSVEELYRRLWRRKLVSG